MKNMWYGVINVILWLSFLVFMFGMDNNFEVEGENWLIWLAERAILGSYLIVTRVITGLKRAVEVVIEDVYGLVTVVIAWINARFWDEEDEK